MRNNHRAPAPFVEPERGQLHHARRAPGTGIPGNYRGHIPSRLKRGQVRERLAFARNPFPHLFHRFHVLALSKVGAGDTPPNPALKRDVPAMKLPARPLAQCCIAVCRYSTLLVITLSTLFDVHRCEPIVRKCT